MSGFICLCRFSRKQMDKLEHPCFPQPPNTSIKVWRYVDLGKFIWTLANRKLWLSRLDLLNDKHEGSIPRTLAAQRDEYLRNQGLENLVEKFPAVTQKMRSSTYVSCWQAGNEESEAMWRLYCPSDQGVAIQTSYQKLVDSLSHDPTLYIGLVRYLDYGNGTAGYPLNNSLYPIMHKRISFAHEREVRIVKPLYGDFSEQEKVNPPGTTVDWDPEMVSEAIYVDPYAPEYYSEVVHAVVERFAPQLESQVRWSPMRTSPVY